MRPSTLIATISLGISITAHTQVVGGTIRGVISDSSGATIPNASIDIRNQDTGAEQHVRTATSGEFAAPSLPVAEYTVTITADGFALYKREHLILTVGESMELPVNLRPAATGSVDVYDQPLSSVNTSTEQTSGQVDSRQLKELPLNGRSYDQLIILNPGTVNYTGQRSGGIGTSNSSVGNMFAVSGRRPQDNLFLLNGIEYTGASLINVTPGGTSGQLLGVDAVREFNMVSDTYSAAYGKRDGAQISIVTASGTDQVHGSAFEFLRNSRLDARNYFDLQRIPEFQRNDFGAAAGGPLRKDKIFLFGNYERFNQNLGLSLVTLVPDAASRASAVPSVKPFLNLWPEPTNSADVQPGIATAASTSPQHIREDFGTLRADANLTPNDLFFAVYTIDDSSAQTPSQNPYSLVDETLREQVLSAQEQHVFSPRLLNTARFGFSRASFLFLSSLPNSIQAITPSFIPGLPTGAVVISGSTASNGASAITAAGVNVGANNAITRNLFTFDDHIFYTFGKHQVEAGVWLQRLQSNDNLVQDQYGQASFASLSSFLAGVIKTFTYAPSPTELNWRTLFADAYLEDTFHIARHLEIRAGIRTESSSGWNEAHGRAGVYTFTNGVIDTNPLVQSSALTDNRALLLVEPRLGLAWDVFGDGTTSIHVGAGVHHSLLDALDYRLDQAAPYNTVYTYSGGTVTSPLSGTKAVSPSTVATDLATPALLSYNLRIEHRMATATTLSVGYNGSRSTHQILSADLNEPAYVIQPNGRIFYPSTAKPNPALANTTSWWSGGSGNYNALIVDLRRSFAGGFQFRANYTWSKNLDDGSAWNTSVSANTPAFVSVPSLPMLDYGPAATDIRHLASISGTYELPVGAGKTLWSHSNAIASHAISGWSLSTIANLQTGFPFSPQLGYNPTGSGDSRNPVRPDVNPAFRGPLYAKGTTAQRATQYFNASAFLAPAFGTVGNAGRDSLVGPGFANWDLSVSKLTKLHERASLQLRAEFFNVLNHTNFQLPSEVVFSSGPSQGSLASQTAAVTLGSPGVITATANSSRQIQLGAKVLF
ncbi:MAG TPA: carboxypeptidase-like regulatory domain-containing protein [Acidobacteriaceae bacterium]|nr:carboxypeptidase-like regulatory domain-containing protein [Acidobacteriaceae bacterium]